MRPNYLFTCIAFFTATTVVAQLYDSKSRYLRTPYEMDRFESNIDKERKPVKSKRRQNSYNSRSYTNYNIRVYKYTKPSYNSGEFCERFRKPEIFDKFMDSELNSLGSPETPNKPSINFKCFCYVPVDIYSLYNFFTSQKSEIEKLRQDFIDGQEKEYLKEMNTRYSFGDTNFKDAQLRFFKSYIRKYDFWHEGGRKMSYGNHRERLLKDLKENSEKFDRVFERRLALSTVISNLKHYKRTDKSNLKKHFGDLSRGGKFVRDIPDSQFQYYDFYNSMLMSGNKWGLNLFHIRDVYNHFKYNPNDLMSEYLVDKYLKQYENEYNLEKRFSLQSAYLIDELNGSYRTPSNKIPPDGFMKFIPYDKNSILDFYKKRPDFKSPNSIMSFKKAKAVMAVYNSFPQNISNYIQNNAYLKTSVISYLENAIPTYEELNTIKEVIESKMNNKPFKWSNQLEYLRDWTYQQPSSPETIMKINLKASLPNWMRLLEYGIKNSFDINFGVLTYEFYMHNGIGNVLRNIYRNPSSWSVEGATIRHFLKQKGLNVPNSLSNYDLGKLFDFGGGNSNTLTIEFSDYAKKFITNFHHGDGVYGTSLFTDPFKLQALKEILDGNTVDFDDDFWNNDVWNIQNPYDDWNRLTECEKAFFKSNPFALYLAKNNRSAAEKASWDRFKNCKTPTKNPMHNTIGDAYRHAYFAALNTQNMGYNNAKKLGDAHECDVPQNKLNEKQMDLHNNAWGYLYGSTVSYISEEQFYTSFMDAFKKGKIKIVQECQ